MEEKDYNQMIFDGYVEQQKQQGLWIEREDHFDELTKMLATGLSIKKPKNKIELSPEQLEKNKAYFDKIKSNHYEPAKTIKKSVSKTDIKEAKLKIIEHLQNITKQRGEELIYDEENKKVLN